MLLVIGVILMAGSVVVAVSLIGGGRPSEPRLPSPTVATSPAVNFQLPDLLRSSPPSSTRTMPALAEPVASDYAIELKIQSKKCYGSAGCNVEVEPSVSSGNPAASMYRCDLTYTISGDESGDVVETADAQGPGTWRVNRTMISTARNSVKPKAAVTDVSCR
ncbi:hypothetical protein [Amycolatopsis suaedae]|uniref:Uncharacterized protein n=1 Tax=Amycolatopsis suaedae TaxID=2510978 RepID=A0A4Q7J2W3_9PSEU|nr:hypothetical protein [Amycolatopsis suaedae]RZQ61279.1 hypothetical protein EWH70_25795 [Amycolatopsis suaedae]